jgi:hypothetical protein
VLTLKKENATLRQLVTTHTDQINALETYSRLDNLIIKGLPEGSYAERASPATSGAGEIIVESQSSVEKSVISFCKDELGVSINSSDISTAHRLKAGRGDTVRPIIVRFANRKARDSIYRA